MEMLSISVWNYINFSFNCMERPVPVKTPTHHGEENTDKVRDGYPWLWVRPKSTYR